MKSGEKFILHHTTLFEIRPLLANFVQIVCMDVLFNQTFR